MGGWYPRLESPRPADAWLNPPPEEYSHEVRRLVALESAQLRYGRAKAHLHEYTRAEMPRRQFQEPAVRAAQDFVESYEQRVPVTKAIVSTSAPRAGLNPNRC